MRVRVPRLSALADYDALTLTALIWFLAKFLRYAFPPLFPTYQAAFGASNAALGAAFTAMMTVYALMQFPSGAVADRLGATKVIAAGAVTAAVGALALFPAVGDDVVVVPVVGDVAAGFVALVAGMLLVGVGTGAHKTVAVGLLSRIYPTRTGRALGVLDTFGAFGGVVAPAAVTVAVATGWADWHTLFLAGGVAGLALVAAFLLRVPNRVSDTDRGGGDGGVSAAAYVRLFRRPAFSAFVAVTLCFSFAYNGAVAFLPLYLTDSAGLPDATASLLYSALFVVNPVQLVTGDLSDRVGRLPVVGATLTLAACGLGALLAVGAAGPAVLGAAVVAFGLGSHGFRPVRGAYLAAVIPDEVAGSGLGAVRTLLMGAGAVAPAVVGVVADAVGFGAAFGVLALALVAAAALTGVVALLES
ncbi:MFS transporter [Halobaculum sp. D14]|uniref:MFS transporter n=1 Tax=unclassified Halobaculum TaxID=2640896 RepID=UPI003EBA8384